MLSFLTIIVSSSVMGIDFGSENVVISVATPKSSIHVAQDLDSQHQFPHYFALWNRTKPSNINSTANWSLDQIKSFRWTSGYTAQIECLKRPLNCVRGNVADSIRRLGLTGFEITSISLAETIASVRSAEHIEDAIESVLATPPSMDSKAKVHLLAACRNIGVKVTEIVDSTTAPAHAYALERSRKFANSSKVVAFVDIGSQGTRVSVFNFSTLNGTAAYKQLAVAFNESLGGSSIDEALSLSLAEKNGIDLSATEQRVNFLNDIRLVKEALAIHPSVDLSFESEEEDKTIRVNRDDLFNASVSFNSSLKEVIETAIRMANTSVDYVELVGGGTRLSCIHPLIKTMFKVKKLSRSLNGAVAIGAGYIAAGKSENFRVKNVSRSVMLTSAAVFIADKEGLYPIFNIGNEDTTNPSVRINIKPNQTLAIFEGGEELHRFLLPNLTAEAKVKIVFAINQFLTPVPLVAYRVKDGLSLDLEMKHLAWSEKLIGSYQSKERALITLENERKLNSKAANDLENLLIKVGRFLDENPKENERIKKISDGISEWFSLRDEDTPAQMYEEKFDLLNSETEKIVNIEKEKKDRNTSIKKFEKSLDSAGKILAEANGSGLFNKSEFEEAGEELKKSKIWIDKNRDNDAEVSSTVILEKRKDFKKKVEGFRKTLRENRRKVAKANKEL